MANEDKKPEIALMIEDMLKKGWTKKEIIEHFNFSTQKGEETLSSAVDTIKRGLEKNNIKTEPSLIELLVLILILFVGANMLVIGGQYVYYWITGEEMRSIWWLLPFPIR